MAEKWPMVQARWYTKVGASQGRNVRLVCVHDMEFFERGDSAEVIAHDFATRDASSKASAHICCVPETPILTTDLRWVPAGDLSVGSGLIGTDEFARGTWGRTLKEAKVTAAVRRQTQCVEVVMADGRSSVCSVEHLWLTQVGGTGKWEWVAADALLAGDRLCAPFRQWQSQGDERTAWLAGFLDGEGCLHKSSAEMSFSQVIGKGVIEHACLLLDDLQIAYRSFKRTPKNAKHNDVLIVSVSGVQANLELLGRTRPVRFIQRAPSIWEGRALGSRKHPNALAVAEVRDAGMREVVSLETSSRTYIANGMVSHNCVDNNSIVQCVYDSDIAYAAPGANHDGIQIELAGYGKQTADEWRDVYSIAVLSWAAFAVSYYCIKYSLPVRRLTVAQVKDGKTKGICGHVDVTNAFHKSDHTDPGENFPWDLFLGMVSQFIKDRQAA